MTDSKMEQTKEVDIYRDTPLRYIGKFQVSPTET